MQPYVASHSRLVDEQTPPRVTTVILNWNGAEETAACVQSLCDADVASASICVIDNASQDDSVSYLRTALPTDSTLIVSESNLGFAGGVNLGIGHGLADGADWILLINNDTRVSPDFYQTLLGVAQSNPDYSLLAPLILYYDHPNVIWSLGDRSICNTLLTHSLLRNRPVPTHLPALVPVDFVSACCLLIHRRVFEKIGLFDPAFFMYGEDADFCWRARKAEFQSTCVPASRIWHKVSWSTSPTSPLTRYWRTLNQIRFYRKSARGGHLALLWIFTLLRCLWLALQDGVRGNGALALSTLRGWWSGWTE